jgi:hypothetical protein
MLVMIIVTQTVAEGSVIYVDADAVGTNNGSSWADAYIYLKDALADAETAEKPVEIRVAQGIYKPDQGSEVTLGNRSASFRFVNDVILRGGFAGVSEENPDTRNYEIYETILSGDLAGNDIDVVNPSDLSGESTRSDNSREIITIINPDTTIELDGLTLTAGEKGISKFAQGDLSVSNCIFKGISHDAIHSLQGLLTITGCTFERNWGHAVFHWVGNMTVTDCLFDGNLGTSGVGINCDAHSSEITLRDCTFTGNIATGPVAAVYCYADRLTLYNCTFKGNVASQAACVDSWVDGDVVAENCTFVGNIGNVIEHKFGRLIVSNCVLAGNRGQAINTHGRYVTILNCTISDNFTDRDGSALDTWREAKISNCIFWGNSFPAINIWPEGVMMNYCNVEGGWPGIGNIDIDPGFVSPGYWESNGTPDYTNDDFWIDGDYHLLSQAGRWDPASESWVQDNMTSPCIDVGDPNAPIRLEPFPNGGRLNVGAYGASSTASKTYFGHPVCDVILAGDINGDCVVDFKDLTIIISHWMMQGEDFMNKAPLVTLIEPQDGAQITLPDTTIFIADASDSDGQVDEVRFYLQYKRNGSTRTHGFGDSDGSDGWEREYTWPEDAGLGEWTVWAEAIDNEGQVSVSPSIVITVQGP